MPHPRSRQIYSRAFQRRASPPIAAHRRDIEAGTLQEQVYLGLHPRENIAHLTPRRRGRGPGLTAVPELLPRQLRRKIINRRVHLSHYPAGSSG